MGTAFAGLCIGFGLVCVAAAIKDVAKAIAALDTRAADREERGVEGADAP